GTSLPAGPVLVAEQLPAGHPVKKSAQAYVQAYEAAYGKGTVSTFGAHAWDAGLLMAAAVPAALKQAQPGTPAFRAALRDALEDARRVGVPSLLALDFQQRAARLKALAKYLGEHKEELYAVSAHTGATRSDGWIDIEGGSGTLFAYAGIGNNELPSGNLVHEGPAVPLGKKGGFAGTHILVPRRG